MAKLTYDTAVRKLRESATNFTCEELKSLLADLGFVAKRGTKGNHHTYKHPGLADFYGDSFDCGHDAKLKKKYPGNVLKVLLKYETELKDQLEKEQLKKLEKNDQTHDF